jgi:hypothetical protein
MNNWRGISNLCERNVDSEKAVGSVSHALLLKALQDGTKVWNYVDTSADAHVQLHIAAPTTFTSILRK